MVFFYVPFALLYRLLRDLRWNRELIIRCLGVTVVLAVLFACVGYVEYATKTLLLNPSLVARADVHQNITVNSEFFDPDIFGRYLALVMFLVVAVLLYDQRRRVQIGSVLVLAILWAGLVLTLSRSSLGALLLGLAVVAFVSSQWEFSPRVARFGMIVAGLLIAYAAAFQFERRGLRIFAEAGVLAGGVIFAAGIALVGQTYHLSGDFSGAVLLFEAGVLAAALSQRCAYRATARSVRFSPVPPMRIGGYGFWTHFGSQWASRSR